MIDPSIVALAIGDGKTLKDSKGRELVFKPLKLIEQARLFKSVGAAVANNAPYMGLAIAAVALRSIDGRSVVMAVTPDQVDTAIDRLGDEGLMAIGAEAQKEADALKKRFEEAAEEAAQQTGLEPAEAFIEPQG